MILVALLEIELIPTAIIAGGISNWDLNNCELMMLGEGKNFPRVENRHHSDMELRRSFLAKGRTLENS